MHENTFSVKFVTLLKYYNLGIAKDIRGLCFWIAAPFETRLSARLSLPLDVTVISILRLAYSRIKIRGSTIPISGALSGLVSYGWCSGCDIFQ